jgi:GTPase SAR1 family protein
MSSPNLDKVPIKKLASTTLDINKETSPLNSPISDVRSAKQLSSSIDRQLKADAALMKKEQAGSSRIILLGTADSGKSTVLRQLVLIHGSGFSAPEIQQYRNAIWRTVKMNFERLYRAIAKRRILNIINIAGLKV